MMRDYDSLDGDLYFETRRLGFLAQVACDKIDQQELTADDLEDLALALVAINKLYIQKTALKGVK